MLITFTRFIIACLFLFSTLLLSRAVSAQTLVISDTDDQRSAIPFVTLLEDPAHTFTIEQVSSPALQSLFKPHPSEYLNLGHNPSVWWLKLDVEQRTSQSWYALINFVALSRVDVFLMPAGSEQLIELGNMRKEFAFQRLPAVRLPETADRFTLYFRVDNHGKERLILPIQLISADALHIKTAKDTLFYGVIIAGLLVLTFYNLFLYSSLRNPAYFLLTLHLICLIFILQRTNNVIPWLSLFSNPMSFYYPLSFQLIGISSIQFWRQLADSKNLFPRSDKVIRAVMTIMIIEIPFIQVLPHFNAWTYTATALLILLFGYFSLLALYKKSHIMFSFSVSFFMFAGSAAPTILWGMGFLAQVDIPVRIFHIGSLLFAVLLSLTLAEHTRQLRLQAGRLKTENAAKDNFLTTMSHELRTPMHAVNSIVHLFKSTPLSDKQENYLNRLEASSNHMLNLINKVLDLGRINNSEFHPEKHPFHLNEILQQICQILSEEAEKKQLRFTIKNDTSTPDRLLIGDPTRLKQVLLNLLHNAIKFTDTGSVTLTVEHTTTTASPDNTVSVQFRVSDTGIGIPQEQHRYIFHAFSQVESSTRRKYGGTGLGLAISNKLVSQMGGTLELDSTPGAGSCFFFTLNFLLHADSETQLTPAAPLPAVKQKAVTVLLVDDVPLNRLLGAELLQILDVTVITAESGEEALQILRQPEPPIDLVLMDVSMPDMDGYETTRRIRSEARFADLPVVALTAHAIEGERQRCLAAGMNDYLSKPFEPKKLQEKICQWTADTPHQHQES